MDDTIQIAFGDAIKATQDGKLTGYLVRFTRAGDYDLTMDRFDAETDFGDAEKYPVLYHHGLDTKIGRRRIGTAAVKRDDVGLWVEAQLNLRDEYEKQIHALASAGKMSWSSGSASHAVEREVEGKGARIKQWYIAEASLTPTPAEPRNQVIALKSLIKKVESEKPEANAEGGQTVAGAVKTETTMTNTTSTASTTRREVTMSDEQKPVEQKPVEQKPAENTAELKSALDALKAELAEIKSAPAKNNGAPAIVGRVSERGFKNDEMKSFLHWIRTGDAVAYKAAMQGQTDSEGGYAVPDDFYNQVVAKRNEVSVMRQAGVQVFQTSLDRVLVPVEDTAATKFVVTAEEGAYSENEPTLAQVAITVHKLTKLIKISEELEADAKANFGGYLAGVWGRTLGLAENYYFCNVSANGSSQPQSVTYASTATTAVASQTAFTAAELLTVIYTVPSAYSNNMAMLMRRATLGAIRALSGNPFSFIPTPDGSGGANTAPGLGGYIHGIPVYVTDDLPAQAAANKPVVVFNPDFYMIVEREGLTVSRNPYLYQANGQIGLFARARMGGAALQAEAAYHLLSKT